MESQYPKSGFSSEKGRRLNMEDTHVCIDDIREEYPDVFNRSHLGNKISYYGVYDGHGGKEAADYTQKYLHENIMSDPSFVEGDVASAMRNGFFKTDKDILETSIQEGWVSGTTVVVSLVTPHHIYLANSGDSEAVLGKRMGNGQYEAILISMKHKPTDANEKERIKKAGGHVVFGRVMGSLAVARSLGDRNFKWPYNRAEGDFVSPDPFINKIDYIPEYDFLIISCDGLWDKLSYEQAVDFVGAAKKSGKDALDTAQLLVKDALDKGTLDNVTAIVIYLNSPSKELGKTVPRLASPNDDDDDDDDGTEIDVYEYLRLESARKKKQKDQEFCKLFELPPEETIVQEYTCYLEKKLLYKGQMAITNNFICFASNKPSFGKLVLESLSINDIETIEKKKSLLMFSSSIQVTTKDGKKFLFNWKGDTESRDFVFSKLLELISNIDKSSKPTVHAEKPGLRNLTVSGSRSENNILLEKNEGQFSTPTPSQDQEKSNSNSETPTTTASSETSTATPSETAELKMNFKNWSRFD